MALNAFLLAIAAALSSQQGDTASRVADTLRIEPLGIRFTIPSTWMGRVPDSVPGSIRFRCQFHVTGPVEDRIVTAAERFSQIKGGIYAPRLTYQTALDSLVPSGATVAHVGGDRFNGNCMTPQIRVFVEDANAVAVSSFGATAERIVGREYARIERAEFDSAAWHIVRLTWTDAKTDWIKPASLEIWLRQYGSRVLILGVMDAWASRPDVDAFLSSVRQP